MTLLYVRLDVGGDKALPYINLPKEENPFLGIRGIRLFKTHPEIMEEQLHAIFVAGPKQTCQNHVSYGQHC